MPFLRFAYTVQSTTQAPLSLDPSTALQSKSSSQDTFDSASGFSTAGATFHDVELFAKHVKPGVKIKAAGGIASLQDAEDFLKLGADRLGTSRIVKAVKELEAKGEL